VNTHDVSAPSIALGIVAAILVGTIAFALWSVRRVKMDPAQFIVGGRSFGTLFLWVLLAGEIYTSFTFLGAAGWAYGFGAPAFYILAYGTCGYAIAYFLLPKIWRVAKDRNLLTGPDFFADRYGSRLFGVLVAVVQFVLVVPYVTLQLTGLQTLLTIAGYDRFNATTTVAAAFVLVALFTFSAGLRGTAWASVTKDVLVLGAVLFAGIVIPMQFFGSPAAMFDQLLREHPAMLTLQPGSAHGPEWFVTTVLLTTTGFCMGPHSWNATYSAASDNTLRRNAMLLPLYQVVLMFVFFAGFAALLIAPGLHDTKVDQSFLLVVQRYYPPWVMGVVAAAGSLAALIPASALLLASASIFSKNVLSDAMGLATSDRSRTLATRVLVIVVCLFALFFWLEEKKTIVELLLLYYNGITQFAPAVFAAFWWRRATVWGVGAGIVVGLASAIYFTNATVPLAGVNPGFAALLLNVVVMIAVSLATPKRFATAVRSLDGAADPASNGTAS
jgi:solute:Na+ symporter, SSS family